MEDVRFIITGNGRKGRNAAIMTLQDGRVTDTAWLDAGERPTWGLSTGEHIYVTDGLSMEKHGRHGKIDIFSLSSGKPSPVGSADTGDNPTSLASSPDGRYLACACYLSGDIWIYRKEEDGKLTRIRTFSYDGHGADPATQDRPYPHSVFFSGGYLYAALLGLDIIARYREEDGRFVELSPITLPPGTGPRCIADGPGGTLLITGELDSALHIASKESLSEIRSFPTTRSKVRNWPSTVICEGERILVSNRGADTVAVLSSADGLTEEIPVSKYPRSMSSFDGMLLVPGQHDGRVEIRDAVSLSLISSFGFECPYCISKV